MNKGTPGERYLGDSVYAKMEGGMIALYTNNGYGPTNEIFLEPEVSTALLDFMKDAYGVDISVTKKKEADDEVS